MILTPLLPEAGDPVDVGADGARAALRTLYAPPSEHWLRLNLIASVDGDARGSDGTSETLSNPADRALLRAIRSLADVVLIGAESFRAEGYLVPRSCRLAVLTGSGDLRGATLPASGGEVTLTVLGPDSAEDRARETLPEGVAVDYLRLPAVDGRIDVVAALEALRVEGMRSVVCEGGPRLAAQLLDAGLVDELCLSTSPGIAGTGLPVLGGAAPRPLALAGLLADDAGGLYARWRPTSA